MSLPPKPNDPRAPVFDDDTGVGQPEGLALCLSGGGYRAMLFHVGALWRLNELGYLPLLDRVSSVSGGSITAATLGLHWQSLVFEGGVATNFDALLVAPLRGLASKTLDIWAVLRGILIPGRTVAGEVARSYRRRLLGDAQLSELPDRPLFVINSTSLQTGVLWRFSKPYMADYTIGVIPGPAVELAVATAASSAFPPILSPLRLKLDPASFEKQGRGPNFKEPYISGAILSDGGVYDNLGLETAWKDCRSVFVSDGGARMAAEGSVHRDWLLQALRVNSVIDNQVSALRKRQTIDGFERGKRDGAYWGIHSHTKDFGPPIGSLPCPPDEVAVLAATPTRLAAMDSLLQERLINWGYAICDVAMRRWVVPSAPAPAGFPYPAAKI
jgi:NTE family protein